MYNLIEYSDNYAGSSGSLYHFKRDESPVNNAGNPINVALNNSTSLKYKGSLLGKADDLDGDDRSLKNAKIVVPLKYLSNFFRSLEMPLVNCKSHLELNWSKDCEMYGADLEKQIENNRNTENNKNRKITFKITSKKLYVPIVTLSSKDNVNLTKQLNEGFKRSAYWNEYKSKIESKNADDNNLTRLPLEASFQGVNQLFLFAFNNTGGPNRKSQKMFSSKSKYHQSQCIN